MDNQSGRHFLQIPGPSNVPDKILRAIQKPTIDHRGPKFGLFTKELLSKTKKIFKTRSDVIIFPSSGTGAWEAALVNTLAPGDTAIMFETGHFATLWRELANQLGVNTEFVAGDWRHGISVTEVEKKVARR